MYWVKCVLNRINTSMKNKTYFKLDFWKVLETARILLIRHKTQLTTFHLFLLINRKYQRNYDHITALTQSTVLPCACFFGLNANPLYLTIFFIQFPFLGQASFTSIYKSTWEITSILLHPSRTPPRSGTWFLQKLFLLFNVKFNMNLMNSLFFLQTLLNVLCSQSGGKIVYPYEARQFAKYSRNTVIKQIQTFFSVHE